MSKVSTVFMIAALLLFFTLSCAESRRSPAIHEDSRPGDMVVETEAEEESCEGPGQDECLMRRTLADRTDYIYTQSNNP